MTMLKLCQRSNSVLKMFLFYIKKYYKKNADFMTPATSAQFCSICNRKLCYITGLVTCHIHTCTLPKTHYHKYLQTQQPPATDKRRVVIMIFIKFRQTLIIYNQNMFEILNYNFIRNK